MKSIISFFVIAIVNSLFRVARIAYIPYVGNYYGLGNRIKGLSNFYARGYRKFLMLWNTESWVTERWDRLFSLRGAYVCAVYPGKTGCYALLRFVLRRFIPVGVVRDEVPFWSFALPPHLQREEMRHIWHFSRRPTYSIDWWFDRVPNDVREYYKPFFAALKPSRDVEERIRTCKVGDAIGVQIRNTDLSEDKKDVASLESIFRLMETFPQNRKFFVSCMTEKVSKSVRARFGERVFELVDKDYSSMVDAVADMWLLGCCPEMIVSPESTFSEVAWWWGGCTSRVTMVGAEYNQSEILPCH